MKILRIIFGIAVFSVMAGACISEVELPLTDSECRLTAVIEESPETRTTLGPELYGASKVLWTEGDRIGIFLDTEEGVHPFNLVEGAGTGQAVFSGYGSGSRYTAVYPLSIASGMGDGEVYVTLPYEQDYSEGTFSSGSYPMVAVSNSSDLSFRNLCSVLKISMTGRHAVTGLVFRTNDSSVKVSGPATVSLSDPDKPVLTMSPDGCDSLKLVVNGVVLDDEKPTDFYLVLPAQAYKGGFTVRVITETGYMEKSLDTDFTMQRARKHDARQFELKLDEGVDPSKTLAGTGTAEDPLLIGSLGDLLTMRTSVNAHGFIINDEGIKIEAGNAHYLLTADLDLSPLCGPETGKSWTPISDNNADDVADFYGTFDGGGHEISHLYFEDHTYGYAGLFGVLCGTVRNLTVSGNINVRSFAGLVAYLTRDGSLVENCVTKGSVSGFTLVGGIVGECLGDIMYSRNEAEVQGTSSIGGIAGYLYYNDMGHCTNTGNVTGREEVGGLAGQVICGTLTDFVNYGRVEGDYKVGGAFGFGSQSAKIHNGVNYGDVKGADYVGALGGYISSYATVWYGPTVIANCINFGRVEATEGGFAGLLAGFAGLADGEEPYGDELVSHAWVKNCYWLSGISSLPVTGGGQGIVESNFALTDEVLKGAKYDGVLYESTKGNTYDCLIDALNAGAVEWGADSKCTLSAWEYSAPGSYPSVSDLKAQMPGSETAVFEVVGKSFVFNVNGGSFEVEVTSSLDYSAVDLPDWIREVSAVAYVNTPHTKVHTFEVAVNKSGKARKCSFAFKNSAGSVRKVNVEQKEPYLTISETEAGFYAIGGSKSIVISSSIDWVVTPGDADSWYSVSPREGYGDGTVTITVSENTDPLARGSHILISAADGSVEHTVTFIQSGAVVETEDESWKELPFYHKSVIMRFTATWCQFCPYMGSAISRAQELYPDKIYHLALHGSESDLEFYPANDLYKFYGGSGWPTGVVDGRSRVANNLDVEEAAANFVRLCKETEDTYGTVSGLAIRSSASGNRVSIDLTGYFKVAGEYKITVLLLEDGIVNYQENGGKDYVHNHVVRASASNVFGDLFTIDKDLSKREFHYNAAVPPGCKTENMRVLAYIHRTFGAYPRLQSANYGDFFIDNSADAPVGELIKVALVGETGNGGGESGGGEGNEGVTPGGEIK